MTIGKIMFLAAALAIGSATGIAQAASVGNGGGTTTDGTATAPADQNGTAQSTQPSGKVGTPSAADCAAGWSTTSNMTQEEFKHACGM